MNTYRHFIEHQQRAREIEQELTHRQQTVYNQKPKLHTRLMTLMTSKIRDEQTNQEPPCTTGVPLRNPS